jgi:hypothetical protein
MRIGVTAGLRSTEGILTIIPRASMISNTFALERSCSSHQLSEERLRGRRTLRMVLISSSPSSCCGGIISAR